MPKISSKLAAKITETKRQEPKKQLSHLIIEALAGTGKTTTLIEGLKVMRGLDSNIRPSIQQLAIWEELEKSKDANSVCFVAFNKSIAEELQRRVPPNCHAMTMHSMGKRAVYNQFNLPPMKDEWKNRVFDLISDVLHIDIRDLRRNEFQLLQVTEKLVGLCKMTLISDPTDKDQLDQLTSHYDIDMNSEKDRVYELVPKVLDLCKDVGRDRRIDFNDMIWLPVVLDLPMPRYDLLLIDEAQDLNRCQQALAKKAGNRLVMCGDSHQAIYGFAGADAESMQRMKLELTASPQGCKVLPLTVTRRCAKAVVLEANKIVPNFHAHETNPEGVISRARYQESSNQICRDERLNTGSEETDEDTRAGNPKPLRTRNLLSKRKDNCTDNPEPRDQTEEDRDTSSYHNRVEQGDMLLCRVTAPLVSQCFKFLKQERKAEIIGRDIGQGLIRLVSKMKAASVADLVGKLSDWHHSEVAKENAKRFPSEAKLIALGDKYDCLLCFTEGAEKVEDVSRKIEAVFTDNKDASAIRLSTIHKAKGLEAKRVFLLEPPGSTVPHPMAKGEWQLKQEFNLRYVAITRSIEELVYVS